MTNYRKSEQGFTLIEMLIVVGIAVILMAIASPSLMVVVRNNRLATQTNDVVTSLNMARSEALARGQMVTICRSTNGTSCDSGIGTWENGWIVITDPDGDGVLDTGESILRSYPGLEGGSTLRSGANFAKYVTYLPNGASRGNTYIGSDSFRLCDSRGKDSAYTVSVNATGRVVTSRTATSCP